MLNRPNASLMHPHTGPICHTHHSNSQIMVARIFANSLWIEYKRISSQSKRIYILRIRRCICRRRRCICRRRRCICRRRRRRHDSRLRRRLRRRIRWRGIVVMPVIIARVHQVVIPVIVPVVFQVRTSALSRGFSFHVHRHAMEHDHDGPEYPNTAWPSPRHQQGCTTTPEQNASISSSWLIMLRTAADCLQSALSLHSLHPQHDTPTHGIRENKSTTQNVESNASIR